MRGVLGRRLFFLLTALFLTLSFPACENPFDPLDTSSEIRGLSYVDFSLTWDRWDSDPEGDGVIVSIEYFNEFGDSLSFNDKPHRVVIEFYSQRNVGGTVPEEGGEATGGRCTFDSLFFSYPVVHTNSDDDIRIPIEAYQGAMAGAGFDFDNPEEGYQAFVNLRVFPPQQVPRPELIVFYCDQTIFEPEETAATPEELLPPPGEPVL
jgi:hypothetical protein